MSTPLFRTVCLLVVTAFALTAAAQDYFVAPDGNDANPGSLEKPFKDPVKAAAKLKAGDSLCFRAGEYRFTTNGLIGLAPGADGEEGKPIAFKNYNDERVKLDLTGSDWGLTNNGYSYILFDGLEIVNKTNCGVKLCAAFGRKGPDGGPAVGHGITVRNCEVHDCGGDCILAAQTENVTVENCRLRGSARSNGLQLLAGCHNAVIRTVTSEGNRENSGIQLNAAAGGIKNVLVENCLIRENALGFSLMGVHDSTFRNNILVNNGNADAGDPAYEEVILWTYGTKDKPGTACENCLFENNTIVNLIPQGHKVGQLVQIQAGTQNVTFRNNIFYIVNKPVFTIGNDARQGHVFENNCLWIIGKAPHMTGAGALADYAKTHQLKASANLAADPGFVDLKQGVLRLKDGSRCIDAGAPTKAGGAVTGKARDIGALEHDRPAQVGCVLPWKKSAPPTRE